MVCAMLYFKNFAKSVPPGSKSLRMSLMSLEINTLTMVANNEAMLHYNSSGQNCRFVILGPVYMKRIDGRIGSKNASEVNPSTCLHGESDLIGRTKWRFPYRPYVYLPFYSRIIDDTNANFFTWIFNDEKYEEEKTIIWHAGAFKQYDS